jgi:hypothetical protein
MIETINIQYLTFKIRLSSGPIVFQVMLLPWDWRKSTFLCVTLWYIKALEGRVLCRSGSDKKGQGQKFTLFVLRELWGKERETERQRETESELQDSCPHSFLVCRRKLGLNKLRVIWKAKKVFLLWFCIFLGGNCFLEGLGCIGQAGWLKGLGWHYQTERSLLNLSFLWA